MPRFERVTTQSHLRLVNSPPAGDGGPGDVGNAVVVDGLTQLSVVRGGEGVTEYTATTHEGQRVCVLVLSPSLVKDTAAVDKAHVALRIAGRLLGTATQRLRSRQCSCAGEVVWVLDSPHQSAVDEGLNTALPCPVALPVLATAARLLAVVHAAGLNHGTLSPSQFRKASSYRKGGGLTVAGFHRRALGDVQSEQAEYEPVSACPGTPAGDIEALGRVAYRWLTGRAPTAGRALDLDVVRRDQAADVADLLQKTMPGSERAFDDMSALEAECREVMQRRGIVYATTRLPRPAETTLWSTNNQITRRAAPWVRPVAVAAAILLVTVGTVALQSTMWGQRLTAAVAVNEPAGDSVAESRYAGHRAGAVPSRRRLPTANAPVVESHEPQIEADAPSDSSPGPAHPIVEHGGELVISEGGGRAVPAERSSGESTPSPHSARPPATETGESSEELSRDAKRIAKRGQAAFSSGNRDAAAQLFHRALAKDTRNITALAGLADCNFEKGRYAQARSFAERAVRLAPRRPSLRVRLGDAYFKVLRYDDAKAQYERAAALGHKGAQRRIAQIERLLGN